MAGAVPGRVNVMEVWRVGPDHLFNHDTETRHGTAQLDEKSFDRHRPRRNIRDLPGKLVK